MEGLSFDFGLRGLLFLAGEAGGTSRTKQSGQHSSEQQASAVQRPEQQQQKGERTTVAAEQCTHCGSLQPGPPGGTYWRQHPTSKEQLCGQCYGRASRYGGELPALSDAEAEQEESEEEQPQQQPLQRQCLQCGSTSKGSTKSAQWHRHPATGEEWLCQPCYQKVDSALKRQHRQAETQAQQEEKSEVELEGEEQPQQQPLQRQCLQCGSTAKGSAKWARWRRHPTTGEGWLCQPCFNDVQAAFRRQKWQAEMHPWQEVESEVEPKEEEHPQQQPLQRQCFQCGSTTKGSAKWATWRRHPITGEEWLCQPCFNDVQAPLRRQRRQAEKQRRQEVEREVGPEEDHSEEEAAIAAAVKQCTHCGSLRPGPAGSRYFWQRHPTSKEQLCGPCWGYTRRHGGNLPALPDEELEGGQEESEDEEEPAAAPEQAAAAPPTARQCTHCGALQPGRPCTSYTWRRHPTTRKQLCGPCGGYVDKHGGELPALSDTALQRMARGAEERAAAEAQQSQNKQLGKRKKQRQQAPAVDEEPPVSPARRPKQRRVGNNQGFLPGLPLQPAQPSNLPVPSQPQPQQVQAQPHQVEPQQTPEGLFAHLLRAARQPAVAAAGLTPKLLASFWAVVDTTRSSQPSDRKVGWQCPTASRRCCSISVIA